MVCILWMLYFLNILYGIFYSLCPKIHQLYVFQFCSLQYQYNRCIQAYNVYIYFSYFSRLLRHPSVGLRCNFIGSIKSTLYIACGSRRSQPWAIFDRPWEYVLGLPFFGVNCFAILRDDTDIHFILFGKQIRNRRFSSKIKRSRVPTPSTHCCWYISPSGSTRDAAARTPKSPYPIHT